MSTTCRSGAGPAVAVRGVQLDVDLALTQDGARTLASGRAGTPSKDNRNLYLVRNVPDLSSARPARADACDLAAWACHSAVAPQACSSHSPPHSAV